MSFISIQESMKRGAGDVSVRGWVHRERGSNKLKFLVLRDSTNIIQCVIERKNFESRWSEIDSVQIETSIEITGEIQKDQRAPTGYEIQVKEFTIIGHSHEFPITKDQSIEFLADNRHLWLRSQKMTAILKIRSTIFGAIHTYFRQHNFYEYQSPIFQPNNCEGGSTVFTVDYFGSEMFLAQSWQLYAEAGIFSLEKIYTVAPSFRAEKSKTSRHLTEYWHAEMEMAWCDFEDIISHTEGLIKHIVKTVLKQNQRDLVTLERDVSNLVPVAEKSFLKMTYTEAIDILKKQCGMEIEWGKDLRTIEEEKLTELYDVPIICTHYPKHVKAFYMKEAVENPDTVLGLDCLAPEGYGEIVGGSQREEDAEKVKKRLLETGEDPDIYGWYNDLRKFGSVPHGGFGLGVERIITWICGLDNIKDSIPFPRTMLRKSP